MEHKSFKDQKLTAGERLKHWARRLKNDVIAMYFAMKHPQTPLYAKVFAAIIVGYALSPIDLIPDFVPVLGYVDDVILLPLCIALAIRIIPPKILEACREKAQNNPPTVKPTIWAAAYVIVMLWLAILYVLYKLFKQSSMILVIVP